MELLTKNHVSITRRVDIKRETILPYLQSNAKYLEHFYQLKQSKDICLISTPQQNCYLDKNQQVVPQNLKMLILLWKKGIRKLSFSGQFLQFEITFQKTKSKPWVLLGNLIHSDVACLFIKNKYFFWDLNKNFDDLNFNESLGYRQVQRVYLIINIFSYKYRRISRFQSVCWLEIKYLVAVTYDFKSACYQKPHTVDKHYYMVI